MSETQNKDTGLPGNKLYINREKWLRGEDGMLLRSDGKMCCLGFMACQLGVQVDDILSLGGPDDTDGVKWPEFMIRNRGDEDSYVANSNFTNRAIHINDDKNLIDVERERDLVEHFATQGIEVIFV